MDAQKLIDDLERKVRTRIKRVLNSEPTMNAKDFRPPRRLRKFVSQLLRLTTQQEVVWINPLAAPLQGQPQVPPPPRPIGPKDVLARRFVAIQETNEWLDRVEAGIKRHRETLVKQAARKITLLETELLLGDHPQPLDNNPTFGGGQIGAYQQIAASQPMATQAPLPRQALEQIFNQKMLQGLEPSKLKRIYDKLMGGK